MHSSLPRSISSADLSSTERCRKDIKRAWTSNTLLADEPMNHFGNAPKHTLTLAELHSQKIGFQECVLNQLIDKSAQQKLEADHCLNWCAAATRFLPLKTQGDANCLLHAASLGMWGFHDREYTLRRAVSLALQNHTTTQLYERWKHTREKGTGKRLTDSQLEGEWLLIVNQASTDVPQGIPLKSLTDFHIYVLANVLKRPIVVYAAPVHQSQAIRGSLLQTDFRGIYLPLEWYQVDGCIRTPLPLAYCDGHFVALLAEEWVPEHYDYGKDITLPLVDYHGQSLPVRFTLSSEDSNEMLKDHLKVVSVADHDSPYITRSKIQCTKLSITRGPISNCNDLLEEFIYNCTETYKKGQASLPSDSPVVAAPPPAQDPNLIVEGQDDQHNPPQSSATLNLETRLENTEKYARDLATRLENTEIHAHNLATRLENTEEHTRNLVTRLDTQAENLATKLANTETHAQDLATRLENTETHAQDLAARLENTETHARNLTTVLNTLETHARELRTLLAGHAPPDPQPWVVSPTEVHMTEEEIGRGGWGSVQVAEFRGQRVAAKTLHDQIISPNNLHLFTREMNMSARAHHPHIVQFIGATIEGVPIILLELMSTSLRRQLAAAPLPTAQALSIATHVSRALNYLHLMQPRPLIHRDVSSANVLLEPAPPPAVWKAKLSDFGATNFVSVMATAGPGNPLYAAPEAFNPYQQTPKMDVFSFGVVLIESFTRQMPSVEARDDLIGRIRWRAVVPLIRRCIEREQERRPAMEAVLTELSQLQRTV